MTLWTNIADIAVRRLHGEDLPACLDLAADREWAREEHKWRLLFHLGEVYGIDAPEGGLAGAAVLTRFGRELCTVGMTLVATRYAAAGLGTKLMGALLESAGNSAVTLYATENGRALYERLGLKSIDTNTTHLGWFTGGGAGLSRPVTGDDLPAIARLDAAAHGVDRSRLVGALPWLCAQLRVVAHDGALTGFGGAWPNEDVTMIGPVVAATPADAHGLIADLAAGSDRPVRLDVAARLPQLGQWAADNGLAPGSHTTIMTRNGAPLPGESHRRFAPVSVALW